MNQPTLRISDAALHKIALFFSVFLVCTTLHAGNHLTYQIATIDAGGFQFLLLWAVAAFGWTVALFKVWQTVQQKIQHPK